jgi:hypothetical protein
MTTMNGANTVGRGREGCAQVHRGVASAIMLCCCDVLRVGENVHAWWRLVSCCEMMR